MTNTQFDMTTSMNHRGDPAILDYEALAKEYYEPLRRFAVSLTHNSVDAGDLVQSSFQALLQKAGQIRDSSKIKSWLFTTLYRNYLQLRRRAVRFPSCGLEAIEGEAASVPTRNADSLDARTIMERLMELDEHYRLPLLLFYVDDRSYREIAETLGLPIGTVMSRLARGKMLLRERLDTVGVAAR